MDEVSRLLPGSRNCFHLPSKQLAKVPLSYPRQQQPRSFSWASFVGLTLYLIDLANSEENQFHLEHLLCLIAVLSPSSTDGLSVGDHSYLVRHVCILLVASAMRSGFGLHFDSEASRRASFAPRSAAGTAWRSFLCYHATTQYKASSHSGSPAPPTPSPPFRQNSQGISLT